MKSILLWAVMLPGLTSLSHAGEITSVYTKLDFEQGCQKLGQAEEEGGGVSYRCEGYRGTPVLYDLGDLRASMKYGFVSEDSAMNWESFSPWNSVNTTIEWRLDDGKPFATILRWFIDNIDPDTGSADPGRRGQVLVISSIAGDGMTESCMTGLVDARANSNANTIAHDVADQVTRTFICGEDTAQYYGIQGPLAPDVN